MKWFLALLLSLPSVALASEVSIPPGVETFPDGVATFVFVGESNGDVTVGELIDTIGWGAEQWDAVQCSGLSVEVGPPVATLDEVGQGEVPVVFTTVDDPCFPRQIDSDLQGIAFTIYCPDYPSPAILLNREDYTWSVEPVPFQSIDQPDTGPIVDLRSVLVHEMGHALGLRHTDDPIATMFPSYRRDGSQATLAATDDLALCALYSGGSNECSADSDCTEGPCVDDGEHAACDTFRGETGDFCSWDTLQCGEQCFFSSPTTGTGYCTESCASNDDCPDQMECRETSNGLELCQFEFGEAEPGCATGSGSAVPSLALFLMVVFSRRRRKR